MTAYFQLNFQKNEQKLYIKSSKTVKYRHKITYLKIQKKHLTGKTKIFVKNE